MHRIHALLSIAIFLTCMFLVTALQADEMFTVYAPDQTNQQVQILNIHAQGDRVSTNIGTPLELTFEPKSMALHPNGKNLVISGNGESDVPVAGVESMDGGKLHLIHSSTLKHPSGYTSIDRRGRYFLTANYHHGTVAVYRLNDDGTLGDETCVVNTQTTEAHCILTTRDNRFAYVPCVKNNNALYQYSFNDKTGVLTPLKPNNASPPAMFGPRHVAYHPQLPIAYFSNEQQLGVSVYQIGADGQLTDKQHAITMPRRSPFEQGKRDLHASDLAVNSDGKMLFVAVRDFNGEEDSIFTFRIDEDGKLSQIARTLVGDIPWKINLSPGGKYLLVSETGDNQLSVFKVMANGSLSLAVQTDMPANVRDMIVLKTP